MFCALRAFPVCPSWRVGRVRGGGEVGGAPTGKVTRKRGTIKRTRPMLECLRKRPCLPHVHVSDGADRANVTCTYSGHGRSAKTP